MLQNFKVIVEFFKYFIAETESTRIKKGEVRDIIINEMQGQMQVSWKIKLILIFNFTIDFYSFLSVFWLTLSFESKSNFKVQIYGD